MNLRKEPIVFIVAALICCWMLSGMLKDSGLKLRGRKGQAKEYVSERLPDLAMVMPDASRGTVFERNLFAPPSATSPLPPLAAEQPPLEELGALAPPTGLGPDPARMGAMLREPSRPAAARDLPGLFAQATGLFPGGVAFEEGADLTGGQPLDSGEDLSKLPDDPEERAARIAGFKGQYDWIYTNSYKFGRILNEDKYSLKVGDDAVLKWVEINPATGSPRFGPRPIDYPTADLREFGLVETPLTTVEQGLASFGNPLLPNEFSAAIKFARSCLLLRNDTPRALEVAEELFARAQAINTQNTADPRLGLALCYELGFKLQEAYATYENLLGSGFDTKAVVHARLGSLMATLRMNGDAERRFEEALRVERTNWEARLRFGRFLMDQGRTDEALPQLAEAVAREPNGADERIWRIRLRIDYGKALFASGDPDGAFDRFASALNADALGELGLVEEAMSGMITAARYSTRPEAMELMATTAGADAAETQGPTDGGFDLLLAAGLLALDQGRYEEAAQTLQLCVTADPFRAFKAYRALSRLAEITGNPEEAQTFALEALRGNPRDAWTLYHLGRLAEARFDDRAAREAYRAALDIELDFAPALERMAAVCASAGEFAAADRYFERAVALEPENAALAARRGWNAFSTGDLDLARRSFDVAKGLSLSLASARAGLAWWHYAVGDAKESATLFGEIVDDRRAVGDADPVATFAEVQGSRILDHSSKEVFRDRFDRQGSIQNGWTEEKGVGPLSALVDGAVQITGQQERKGRTRVFRKLPPERFIAFSCLLTVGPNAKGSRSGLFISSERAGNRGTSQVRAEIALSRGRDGDIEVRVQASPTDEEAAYRVVRGPVWPIGEPVRVSIERSGEDLDSRFTLFVDGEPVADGLDSSSLTASRQALYFGAFVEGDPSRRADLTIDDVRVVRRR